MKYNYICPKCQNETTKEHRIIEKPRIICADCLTIMEKSFKGWDTTPAVNWGSPPDTASGGRECK